MKKDNFSVVFFGILLIIFRYYFSMSVNYMYFGVVLILLGVVAELYPYFSKLKRFSKAELANIDQMKGIEFEEYMAFLLEKAGYIKPKVTQAYGDQGIDIIAKKDDVKLGIQCKRWKKKVGNKAVQEVHAGIGYYSLDKAIVVTNSYFTESAEQLAKKLDVELWDRTDLTKLLEQVKKQAK
ncbi:restriction endonuclease [Candidatus Enterococcus moelleringii]|nr:restriction endonuclease [Enterococcus sp. 669A]